MAFEQFQHLPAELQSQIWEACVSPPSMHIFDVCSPEPQHEKHGVQSEELPRDAELPSKGGP